ncbi:MAG: helix-turn-helix transcriptional regulator [Bryobacterales bacterium]|nr:helix-turn-helix transcriptional regulator [Bryobacteraceae bacterium]MDW8354542.1 helix-turn-helix transcriptional regulator [Bryobacterales bacterium]
MPYTRGPSSGEPAVARKDHSMEEAGLKLKRARERLNLRYRDVEEASLRIAERHNNSEFGIALSRLADIENKGTVPTIYRLYSLCAIYRLDLLEVLEWYGINLSEMPADAATVEVERTHLVGFGADGYGDIQVPLSLDPGLDLRRTTYLSRFIQRWGKLPLMLLNGLDLKNHRYAFIGTEDWSMYPLLAPGSLVLIDETRRKIASGGWTNEFERPIYFLEHRDGYACGWCSLESDRLTLQPHPASACPPRLFAWPDEVDVIGQVAGVAMRLDLAQRRRTRS